MKVTIKETNEIKTLEIRAEAIKAMAEIEEEHADF